MTRRTIFVSILHAGCSVLMLMPALEAGALAQAPIANAKTATRSAAQGLEREVQAVVAASTPAWIGYRLPAAQGSRHTCLNGSRILLEPPAEFFVLARVEAGRIVQLRTLTPECDVDAGGMPLIWLTDVKGSESVAWLAKLATTAANTTDDMNRFVRPGLRAIAMHADGGASMLADIVRSAPTREVRKQAMSRLAESKDARAVKLLEEFVTAK